MSAPLSYRLLLRLLSPALLLYTARQGRLGGEKGYLRARLGHGPRYGERPLWLHAASVGEVNAVIPLLRALQQRHPGLPLLLTTTTPSGAQRARALLPEGVAHDTLPIDLPPAVARFLSRVRPRALLPVETEIWPQLYSACADAGVPVVIVNGRLSSKTLEANRWLRGLYRGALQSVSAVLARGTGDAEGFCRLGAPAERVQTLGNIKFAAEAVEAEAIDLGRPYLLAASTREGEERLVVEAWLLSKREELLVIAPRHIQRLEAILTELAPLGLECAVRSRDDAVSDTTQLYIADTFGELRGFMAGAELVFMGGSLVEKGGHNLLEPAALGKAVICGPHMDNFTDETRLLREADALLQVASAGELASTLATLMDDDEQRIALGQHARTMMVKQGAVLENYLQHLESCLGEALTQT